MTTIEINNDISCPKCGEPGATQGGKGLCLKCTEEKIRRSKSVKLGEKTLNGILDQVRDLLSVHTELLNVAYIKHDEEKFSVSFKTVIERKGSANKTETTISYKPEPDTKDSTDGIYDEDQMELFDNQEEAA
jgi:hypothetical protein